MQNVDVNFIHCLTSPSRYELLTGNIVLNDSVSMPVDLANIKDGSVSITWDNSGGQSDIAFGLCVCPELDMTIFTELNRYQLEGSKITLNYRVWDKQPVYEDEVLVNDAIYSDCPLGIFTAYTVTKDTYSHMAHILAYDDITKLDKPCGTQVFSGKPYTILTQVCSRAGLTFNVPEQTFDSLYPNTSAVLQFDVTTGAKTYREIVKFVGQLLGTCFRANRSTGEFEVFQYAPSTTYTVTPTDRHEHRPADYMCRYKGVQVTSVKGTYKSISNDIQNAMVMYIDDAPAWDYGLTEDLDARVVALGNYVRQLQYTPCTANLFSNPMFDCGDNIAIAIDDNSAHNINMMVTSVTWKFRGGTELKSIGTNLQDTGVKKDSARQISRTTDSNKLVSYDLTNTNNIVLHNNETATLCDVSFTSAQATHAMWLANILVNTTASNDFTDVKITYFYDNEELTFYPIEHYTDGNHDFSLFFPISAISEASVHRWKVTITALNGTVSIPQYDFRGTLFGQNLVEKGTRWDGILTFEDFINNYVSIVVFSNITEGSVTVSKFPETSLEWELNLPAFPLVCELQTLSESCTIIFSYRDDICFCGENYYCGTEGVLL